MRTAKIREWPYGFLDDFWNIFYYMNQESSPAYPTTSDMEALIRTIDFVLATAEVPDRERDIIYLRYRDKKTYNAIGEQYGITGRRVHQVCHNGIRHIKQKPQLESMLLEAAPEYEPFIRSRSKRPARMNLVEKVAQGDILLGDLGLHAKTFFALYRSDHRTVGDVLVYKDKSELMRIYGFGKKSYEAVIRALEERGFDVEHLR